MHVDVSLNPTNSRKAVIQESHSVHKLKDRAAHHAENPCRALITSGHLEHTVIEIRNIYALYSNAFWIMRSIPILIKVAVTDLLLDIQTTASPIFQNIKHAISAKWHVSIFTANPADSIFWTLKMAWLCTIGMHNILIPYQLLANIKDFKRNVSYYTAFWNSWFWFVSLDILRSDIYW